MLELIRTARGMLTLFIVLGGCAATYSNHVNRSVIERGLVATRWCLPSTRRDCIAT